MINIYKSIFIRTKNLIVSPKKEWETILNEKDDFNSILSSFVLPYLAITTLTTFICELTSQRTLSYEIALKKSIVAFSSLFIGLLASYFIASKVLVKFVEKLAHKNSKLIAFKLVAYPSFVLYLITLITKLAPQTSYLQIITLYSGYIIYKGTNYIGKFENNDLRIVLTIILTILILFLPFTINILFGKLNII